MPLGNPGASGGGLRFFFCFTAGFGFASMGLAVLWMGFTRGLTVMTDAAGGEAGAATSFASGGGRAVTGTGSDAAGGSGIEVTRLAAPWAKAMAGNDGRMGLSTAGPGAASVLAAISSDLAAVFVGFESGRGRGFATRGWEGFAAASSPGAILDEPPDRSSSDAHVLERGLGL